MEIADKLASLVVWITDRKHKTPPDTRRLCFSSAEMKVWSVDRFPIHERQLRCMGDVNWFLGLHWPLEELFDAPRPTCISLAKDLIWKSLPRFARLPPWPKA